MAFTNIPPNLQDIFYSITDRIAKLETAPNQAMVYAQSAQSTADAAQGGATDAYAQALIAQAQAVSAQGTALVAQTTASTAAYNASIAQAQAVSAQATAIAANTAASTANANAIIAQTQAVSAQSTALVAQQTAVVASAQAITATNTANAAASQATIAQSQATIASSQATTAQVTANGKNSVYYSTSTPGATANKAGDIWYQYGTVAPYINKVIAQWTGAGGTTWNSVTVSGLVIANIDAGTVTTGILSAIEITAGTGAQAFHVSPTGYMSAQGVYVRGNITADSGTFTGQVNAQSGYFGSPTNGWQINSTGITGLGSGYIAGGAIQGTTFNNNSGTFTVDATGYVVAQNIYAKGNISATSGYFGSATNGWIVNSAGITGVGSGFIAGGAIQGTTFNNNSGTFSVDATGYVVAQNLYAKGNINAISGNFGNATNGWRIDTNGITGIGSGYIAGGQIQGTTFNNNSGTFYVDATGYLVAQNIYAKGNILGTSGYFGSATNGWNIDSAGITGLGSGYINGGAIQGTTVTGGIIQTSTGTTAVKMVGSSNSLDFINGGTTVGKIYPWASNGIYMSYSTGTYPAAYIGSSTATLAGSSLTDISSGTSSNTINGSTYCYGNFYLPNHTTTASAANAFINSTSGLIARSTASSQEYKTDIVNLTNVPELDPKALYDLPVRAFRFKDNYLPETDDRAGMLVPGFIAEEVDAIYPIAADYVEGKGVETWNDRMIIPALLALIQEQNERIKTLENKLNT